MSTDEAEDTSDEQPKAAASTKKAAGQDELRVFSTKSPLDGSDLTPVQSTSPSDIPALARKARDAQRAWAERSPRERASIIADAKNRLLLSGETECRAVLRRRRGSNRDQSAAETSIGGDDAVRQRILLKQSPA